jgi:hypothetical protein
VKEERIKQNKNKGYRCPRERYEDSYEKETDMPKQK